MPIPLLTPFPDPPRIYQPEEEFDAKADEMAGHLPILVTEVNAMAEAVNTELADIDSSVTAAAYSAAAAAGSANTATTKASAAATSEANALASKNAAETSATNAANSANTATTKASAAATSEANALASKNAAETSATNAANSANTAAAVGTVIFYPKSIAPTGFLKANGAAVSRTTYADLYAVIGTVFGAGDGSTTFNLPDLRGEFLRGWHDGRIVDSGRVFGSAQTDAIKSHNHAMTGAFDGSPLSGYTTGAYKVPGVHGGNTTWTEGGSETRPRNVALLACIRY